MRACVGKTTCTSRYVLDVLICYWPNKLKRIAQQYFLLSITRIQSVLYVCNIVKVYLQGYNTTRSCMYEYCVLYCE